MLRAVVIQHRNSTGSIMRSPVFSFSILRSLRIFNNNLIARASEFGPLLKEGSKVIVESSGRLVGGSCGQRRKIVEENGGIIVVENLQSTLVEVPNSGGWGVRVLMEERATNRSPKL